MGGSVKPARSPPRNLQTVGLSVTQRRIVIANGYHSTLSALDRKFVRETLDGLRAADTSERMSEEGEEAIA